MQQHTSTAADRCGRCGSSEGLEGNRFAIISKVHHCMIDGVSGVDIMKVLMSLTPEYEEHDAPAYVPRPGAVGDRAVAATR
jgi:hypothetical protein